ncbi:acyltransferase family protein [Pseudomarimonas salicorniae]|uniref:Acyltransferase n=1 Tax=Pseudomarimonas salicorniae TaxID=2933270 RepID=A0ABT0GM18_9GAMM|nr:acyltransferase [Lysobacter sp. CAU 1642]MCK7595468.1 acyltransferase [Lysobacter sp. CAU 1642]
MSEAEAGQGGRGTRPPGDSGHYLWLDALRAFAALSVLGYHLIVMGGLEVPVSSIGGWLNFGFLGVDLFFALSGAVMVISTRRLIDSPADGWRMTFTRRRLARIVPLYLASCVLFLLVVEPFRLQQDDALWNLASHALFLHNLFPSLHGALNGPSWSLGVEMQFYALLLLIAPWALRVSPAWLLISAALVSVAWRLVVFNAVAPMDEAQGAGHGFFLATQLPGVMLSFAGGAAAARLLEHRRPGSDRASNSAWIALLALLAWGAAGAALLHLQAGYWTRLAGLLGAYAAVCVATSISIWLALRLPAPPRRLAALIRGAGNLSYGIYLWHAGVILLLLRLPVLSKPALALACLGITLALSWTSWRLLERPCLRWARGSPSGATAPRQAGT